MPVCAERQILMVAHFEIGEQRALRFDRQNPINLLFLGANPLPSVRLRVDAEAMLIKQICAASASKARPIDLDLRLAVQPDGLQAAIVEALPEVVHLAAHSDRSGITLDDGNGGNQHVRWRDLGDLFRLAPDNVKFRVLVANGCYTESVCFSVRDCFEVVIGSKGEIADDACLAFAHGFYTAVSDGNSIAKAVRCGKLKMQLLKQRLQSRGNNLAAAFSTNRIVVFERRGVIAEQTFL
jgi:hypothetical protein